VARATARTARLGAHVPAVFAGAAGLSPLHWVDAAMLDRWHGESLATGAPALLLHPEAYDARVIDFFDQALHPRAASGRADHQSPTPTDAAPSPVAREMHGRSSSPTTAFASKEE
jgi:hypothetical protein